MLRALTALIQGATENSQCVDQNGLVTGAHLLHSSELYESAFAQLSATAVEGCIKDFQRALACKLEGNKHYKAGDYDKAVRSYSDALKWLNAAEQPSEAATIHANRAQGLLKLSAAAAGADAKQPGTTCCYCQAASVGSSNGAHETSSNSSSSSSTGYQQSSLAPNQPAHAAVTAGSSLRLIGSSVPQAACKAHALAYAADEDCCAAMETGQCTGALQSKFLFRRATARMSLCAYQAAAEDCELAAAAAKQAGNMQACKDIQQLLQTAGQQQQQQQQLVRDHTHLSATIPLNRLTLSEEPAIGSQVGTAPAAAAAAAAEVVCSVHQQAKQRQDSHAVGLQQRQPPVGPSLEQLNLLLYYQQQQALQLWQQQLLGTNPAPQQQEQGQRPLMQSCYDAAAGRHVVAAAAVPAGTILLAEAPLAAVPVKAANQRRQQQQQQQMARSQPAVLCDWCFEPVGIVPWYCTHCPLVAYCSRRCHTAAAAAAAGSSHRPEGLECGRPWCRLLPEQAVLASRCIVAAAAAIARGDLHDPQQQQQQQQTQQLRTDLFRSLQQSCLLGGAAYHPPPPAAAAATYAGSSHSSSSSDLDSLLCEQIVLAHLISDIHHIADIATKPGGKGFIRTKNTQPQHQQQQQQQGHTCAPADVLTCLGQIVLNGIAIRPLLISDSDSRRGIGLYPVTALFNHDCNPNCSIRFVGRQLLLVCHRGAAAGEQLTISYGPQVGEQPTAVRQQLLLQQYGFACRCKSCIDGLREGSRLQILEAAAAAGLKCCCQGSSSSESCSGVVVLSATAHIPAGVIGQHSAAAAGSSNSSSSSKCSTCGWVMPQQLLQSKLQELAAAAAAAEQAAALMVEFEASTDPVIISSSRSRQQQAQQALQLLQRSTAVRQQHLHPFNQLLGQSHHQAAAAAAAAAAISTAGISKVVQIAVQLLQRSLQIETAEEVGDLLIQLEQQIQEVSLRHRLCNCPECSSACTAAAHRTEAVEGTLSLQQVQAGVRGLLQMPCTCWFDQAQEGCATDTGASSSSSSGGSSTETEILFATVLQHLAASTAVLEAIMSADALALAIERLCTAAAVVAVRSLQQQQQQQGNAMNGLHLCCRCTKLVNVGKTWFEQAHCIIMLHLGIEPSQPVP